MSAIRDDEGSAESRSSERNLADIKLLRKVLKTFIWSDLELDLHKILLSMTKTVRL